MDHYLKPLIESFRAAADENAAKKMSAYLRNQFEFLGIKTPQRKKIFAEFLESAGIPAFDEVGNLARQLFELPEREFHQAAIDLCARTKRDWTKDSVDLFEELVKTKSWWDSVDSINTVCIRPFFGKFPVLRRSKTKSWNWSDNIWLQRVSIICQLRLKEDTDLELLEKNIDFLRQSDEFFVQKAIGWALRDYGHHDPDWVRGFVSRYELKPLSEREALKHIKQ